MTSGEIDKLVQAVVHPLLLKKGDYIRFSETLEYWKCPEFSWSYLALTLMSWKIFEVLSYS